jgi:multidrug resistance efflux pump
MRQLALMLGVVVVLIGLIAASQLRTPAARVSGMVEADEIRVGSRVGGRVAAVEVAEGDRVVAGQALIVLEPFDLLQQEDEARQTWAAREAEYQRLQAGLRAEEIAQARARLDQAEARLDLLRAGPREQEIAVARERVRVAAAELALAKQNHTRNSELFAREAISREEFDRTVEQLEAADALASVRRQELELLELGARDEEVREAAALVEQQRQAWELAKSGYRPEEVAQARAARDAAQAALDAVLARKQELVIRAPVDGTIEALDLQPGDLAPAGAPVLSLLDARRLWIRAYVPQNRIGVRVGQQLSVTVDSVGERRFVGRVTYVARQAEFTPSNVQTPEERDKQAFRIKVELPDVQDWLRPGMSADVWLAPLETRP